MTATDVARLLGRPERTVRRWAQRLGLGRMVTRSVRLLGPEDVEVLRALAEHPPRRGRPLISRAWVEHLLERLDAGVDPWELVAQNRRVRRSQTWDAR
jgi:hypothetical protein